MLVAGKHGHIIAGDGDFVGPPGGNVQQRGAGESSRYYYWYYCKVRSYTDDTLECNSYNQVL